MRMENETKPVELHEAIINIIAAYFCTAPESLTINTSRKVNHELAYRKHVCYYMIRRYTFISYDQIALAFNTSYSTIRNGACHIDNLLSNNRRTMDDIKKIKVLVNTFNEKTRESIFTQTQ